MMNEIPGRYNQRRIIEQEGYQGRNFFSVKYAGQEVTVHCADANAALFLAAKYWGYAFRRAEYHQTAKAMKLGYIPVDLR